MNQSGTMTLDHPTTERRLILPFAPAAEWPWHAPASAGIRKEFHLPPGGPFTG